MALFRLSFQRLILTWAVFALTALTLTACGTTTPPPGTQGPIAQGPTEPVGPVIDDTIDDAIDENALDKDFIPREGLTPPHMANRNIRRLALILPFSSPRAALRAESDSLLKAAEMAVFAQENNDVLLLPFDSQGTLEGTEEAVLKATESGADVILGPILSASVRKAAEIAQPAGIPVIGFSTDQRAAGNGSYLLSFPPESEINRIVQYAREGGVSRFAFLGPENAYGRRIKAAYERAVNAVGGQITAYETYKSRDISAMQAPAQRLADIFTTTEATREDTDPYAFEAIILPESGVALRTLAPLLTYYSDDLRKVQLLGTARWQDEDTAREPALNGGVFAGPDITERKRFDAEFDRIYGQKPGRLASLAFDAVSIGNFVSLARTRQDIMSNLQDPVGFYGIDGLIRFNPNGMPERALAIYEIKNGKITVLEPAPKTSLDPS